MALPGAWIGPDAQFRRLQRDLARRSPDRAKSRCAKPSRAARLATVPIPGDSEQGDLELDHRAQFPRICPQAGRLPLTGPPSSCVAQVRGALRHVAELRVASHTSRMAEKLSPPNPPPSDGVVGFVHSGPKTRRRSPRRARIRRFRAGYRSFPFRTRKSMRGGSSCCRSRHGTTAADMSSRSPTPATDRYVGSVGIQPGSNPRRHAIGYMVAPESAAAASPLAA